MAGWYKSMPITNSRWLIKSLFNNNENLPLDVNNQYIQLTNNSGLVVIQMCNSYTLILWLK